jgi:hypothetical protein
MACERKVATGFCDHYQCPYMDETAHGYECVEVIEGYWFDVMTEDKTGLCECGDDCLPQCKYSFDRKDQVRITEIFSERY